MGENHMRENPIGVFDSGVGGLTVAREIINQLPNENIVYFGVLRCFIRNLKIKLLLDSKRSAFLSSTSFYFSICFFYIFIFSLY